MEEKISGIYKITCLVNGKVYVGQSKNIKTRWKEHISTLKNNRHDNIYLQRAYNKYGKDNFIFEIIGEYKSNLDDVEKYWISYFDSFNNGFNLTVGGRVVSKEAVRMAIKHNKGKPLSEEHKNKIGKSIKGAKNGNSTPIYQFDKETLKILKRFDCIEDAETEMGTHGGVWSCVSKNKATCKGFYWQKVENTIDGKYIGKIKPNVSHRAKKINQIDLNTGEIINTFRHVGEANIYLNKNKGNGSINSCLNGITKKAFGYKWERVKES